LTDKNFPTLHSFDDTSRDTRTHNTQLYNIRRQPPYLYSYHSDGPAMAFHASEQSETNRVDTFDDTNRSRYISIFQRCHNIRENNVQVQTSRDRAKTSRKKETPHQRRPSYQFMQHVLPTSRHPRDTRNQHKDHPNSVQVHEHSDGDTNQVFRRGRNDRYKGSIVDGPRAVDENNTI
jgi:hypothetical protein